MSYVLHIWEQPVDMAVPDSIGNASKMVDALHQLPTASATKFPQLVKKLTKKFPCICSPRAEKLDESEWAWSDGPLDGMASSAVYTIGLSGNRLKDVQPFVVEQAICLGMNVMDEQAGAAYLADGKVLGQAPVFSDTRDPDDLPTASELRDIVFERLSPILAPHGFKPRKSDKTFQRKFKEGHQEVGIGAGDMHFGLYCWGRNHAAVDFLNTVVWHKPASEIKRYLTYYIGQQMWPDEIPEHMKCGLNYYSVDRYYMLEEVLAHAFKNVESRLIPALNQCTDIQGLDALLNPVPIWPSTYWQGANGYQHLVIAHLAGNPRIEAILAELKQQPSKVKEMLAMWEYLQPES